MQELLLGLAAAMLGWALTGLVLRTQSAAQHAVPNERSMHSRPVPVGGGLAIVVTAALLWVFARWPLAGAEFPVLGGFALLAAVSWIDDRRSLWPATRFAVQGLAVTLCLLELPREVHLVSSLPLWLERVSIGIGWLWFINLYNFMDGIDGIAGSEAIAVTLGYLAVTAIAGLKPALAPLAVAIAGAAAGYLVWNWHPARIFMGDVGSIPLGFIIGWLMLDLARQGHYAPAVILPAVFATDATITLLRRLAQGAKPWDAHKTHFYQRAVTAGATHADVVLRVSAANVMLILAALIAITRPWLGLAMAVAVTAGLLWRLAATRRPAAQVVGERQ